MDEDGQLWRCNAPFFSAPDMFVQLSNKNADEPNACFNQMLAFARPSLHGFFSRPSTSTCATLSSACGSVRSAFVSQPHGCEFESRSNHFSFLLLARDINYMQMPVNTAVRAVVRSPGKAAPAAPPGVLCLRVGALQIVQRVRLSL